MIVLAVLAYAAWFVYTRNAKHSAPVWGHRYAKPQSREKWAVLFFISLVLARGSGAPTAHLLSSAVRRWAARIAAAVCRLIGLVCGLTFAVKFEDEAGLQAEHRGLVAAVGPHGVFPLAMLGFGAFKFRRDCGFGEPGLTELNARFAGASVCFLVPVIRELLLLMGVRDANRSTLKRLLASNHSVAIQPGGIWEMVMSDSRQVCDGHAIPHPLSPWAARSLRSSHSLCPSALSTRRRPSSSSARSASCASRSRWEGRSSLATRLERTSSSNRGEGTGCDSGSRASCASASHSSRDAGGCRSAHCRDQQT